jgi:predicted kinase
MDRTAILLVGMSGSGKSHRAAQLVSALPEGATHVICSADHWMVNARGAYEFKPELLGYCHRRSEGCFKKALAAGVNLVISDNTNLKGSSRSPYIKMAWKAGYRVEMHLIDVDPAVAFSRQLHGCPEKRHVEQARQFGLILQKWGPGVHVLTPVNYPMPGF